MSTTIDPILSPPDQDLDKGRMVHWVCLCSPKLGMCGREIRGIDVPDEIAVDCVVCEHMRETEAPCPRCGE